MPTRERRLAKKQPKPGLIPRPTLPDKDQLGGNTFEDHYRRWLLADARICNRRMRQDMMGG